MEVDWEQGVLTRAAPTGGLSDRQRAVLEKLVQNTIVPRLLSWTTTADAASLVDAPKPVTQTLVTEEHIGEFAELVIKRDVGTSIDYFEAMRARGVSVEVLFQDLLAPVARRLGELWDEDINDFMDVTRGAAQLQQIVREYSDAFQSEARQPVANRRALLMPLPGEQHMFGISLVGEHYRRAGWHVWGGPPRTLDDILELVGGQWFDVIALSVSRVPDPEKVATDIAQIRQRSMNKTAIIQIGGKAFIENPDLVALVGADATAIDGKQAVLQIADIIGQSNAKSA